jgi:hypothetical protein
MEPLIAESRTYRVTGTQQYVMLAILTIFTVFTPFVLAHAVSSGNWFELAWVAVVLWFWVTAIWRAAYRFEVSGDVVEFGTILWRRRTPLQKIRSIRAFGPRYVIVQFEGGRADLYGPIDGWPDFVARVKAANPAVELKGRLSASVPAKR